jgi:uncharacterized protein
MSATNLRGQFVVPADQLTVWTKLNDPDVLKACISGCDSVEKLDDTHLLAIAKVKVGPLRATIRGSIELQDVDAPNGCRIVGKGEGGLLGFASGAADLRLIEGPEGTTISYAVEALVGGRLTKLAGPLIDGVAQRIAQRFFAAFSAVVAPDGVEV